MPSLLILGGADCLFEDAARAQALGRFDALMAINDAIAVWPEPIDYAVTLHPDKFAGWFKSRALAGFPGRPVRWAHKFGDPGKIELPPERCTDDWSGSSGLFAIKIGIEEGFDRIVLAGVPMDARNHFKRRQPWKDVTSFTQAWLKHRKELAPFVKSMSGWSKELFGEPTKEFLAG